MLDLDIISAYLVFWNFKAKGLNRMKENDDSHSKKPPGSPQEAPRKPLRNLLIPLETLKSHFFLPKTAIFWGCIKP